jgi:photosystem II stability/assembly factor-like uncharacterized protein
MSPKMRQVKSFILSLILIVGARQLDAQKKRPVSTSTVEQEVQATNFPERSFNALNWRSIGPFRGGRSAAVTGVPGKPNLYYFGSTGGGVWKTQDAGQTWENISDGFFGGSIGSIAVSDSDPNVIYVGGGEVTVRGNVSYGYGMWKSTDAGKTWKNSGLPESKHIPRIRIHPKNPDLVYAAVMGDLFKSSPDRGVYRSKDGGINWEKILFANQDAGAVDLAMDPNNARVLYASTWRIRRTPYDLSSGGEGSDLWKSTDGGDNWTKISSNKGLPKGPLGIIGITVSPVNSEKLYAIIEANDGGVYRSENAGASWIRTNEDRNLRQRAWYYTRIYADTKNEDVVYVMNVNYHRSGDGGRTFNTANAQHGDHHDLWIAPEDSNRMIIGDDGGGQVSLDGGTNWSTYHNQPTAQFYRVTTDNHFPYRIYGAQQDNSTLRVYHRTEGSEIGERDWEETAGGESAHLAVDPTDNDVVYGSSYGGLLERVNHRTKQNQSINVWPDNPMGYGAEGAKFRFQWNFPVFTSPNNPKRLYAASQHVHASDDGGRSWTTISPDLTRNDRSKMKSSGGPITQDNTSVEYYGTVFAACESPIEAGLLWAGSDDGLIHVSKDNGASWENVTPAAMPEWMMINSLEIDPFRKGGLYVAGTRYKSGDYTPYLYHTTNYGKSWELITAGIDKNHFTRVIRADPKRAGLLYAGTESGMYLSFDNGVSWKPFQLNLPIVPITDLAIKNDNLIAATQGRSFWIIDDLTPLHQLNNEIATADFHLFKPMPSYRMEGGPGWRAANTKTAGTNHPGGVMVHFNLKEVPADSVLVSISFQESDGKLIKEFSSNAKERTDKLPDLKSGGNRFVWNMQYPGALRFDGMILWAAGLNGPKAIPGTYKVVLRVGKDKQEQNFEILKDPRSESTSDDFKKQFNFLIEIRDKVTEAHQAILDIRETRKQLTHLKSIWKDDAEMKSLIQRATDMDKEITKIENELYQTKNRSGQDPLNYPIKLTNKLAHVGSLTNRGDFPPTQQATQVRDELNKLINAELQKWEQIKSADMESFNKAVREKGIDVLKLKKENKTS